MKDSPQCTRLQGFTVAEVLMVVLLLAAVLALVIVNYFSFENAFAKRPVEDQVRRAVAEAHWLARTQRQAILLSYDADSDSMQLRNEAGLPLRQFLFPKDSDTEVKLFHILPDLQFGEDVKFEQEENAVPMIRITSYGSSAPFVVELNRQRELVKLRFDPFSAINWRQSDAL